MSCVRVSMKYYAKEGLLKSFWSNTLCVTWTHSLQLNRELENSLKMLVEKNDEHVGRQLSAILIYFSCLLCGPVCVSWFPSFWSILKSPGGVLGHRAQDGAQERAQEGELKRGSSREGAQERGSRGSSRESSQGNSREGAKERQVGGAILCNRGLFLSNLLFTESISESDKFSDNTQWLGKLTKQ